MHWRPVLVHVSMLAIAVLTAIPREISTQSEEGVWFGSGQILVIYAALATIINNVPVISRWVYGSLLRVPGPEEPGPG